MNKQKGFTIIELIIYIGLFSTVLIILTQIITSTLNLQLENQTISTVEQDSRYILNRLNYDIPRATSITLPSVYGTAGKQTELQVTINGVINRYYLNGGNLMLDYSGNSIRLNGYDSTISNLYFTRYNSSSLTPVPGVNLDNIQVEFVVTSKSKDKSGIQTRSFKTNLSLRCYSNCL